MREQFPPEMVILDAGAQYVDLIKKACERHGFPAVVLPIDTPIEDLPPTTKGIFVSGGPADTFAENAPMPDTRIWDQDEIPTFNICYGAQALAQHKGGSVGARTYRADGRVTTTFDTSHAVFNGVREKSSALFTQGNFIDEVPDDVVVIGEHRIQLTDDEDDPGERVISAIATSDGRHIGTQFHTEIFDDTP